MVSKNWLATGRGVGQGNHVNNNIVGRMGALCKWNEGQEVALKSPVVAHIKHQRLVGVSIPQCTVCGALIHAWVGRGFLAGPIEVTWVGWACLHRAWPLTFATSPQLDWQKTVMRLRTLVELQAHSGWRRGCHCAKCHLLCGGGVAQGCVWWNVIVCHCLWTSGGQVKFLGRMSIMVLLWVCPGLP